MNNLININDKNTGLILKSGEISIPASSYLDVTFHNPFTSECIGVLFLDLGQVFSQQRLLYKPNKNGFRAYTSSNSNDNVLYIAFGY
nr:MAG TPA: putative tail fiber protein [Caudoviricetes sp.]